MYKIGVESTIEFVIYGAGEVGTLAAQNIAQNGLKVRCFIDAKKEGDDIVPGYYVFSLERLAEVDHEKCIVIIALANGNVHKDIADYLYKNGFLYIVFLPISCYVSLEEKRRMTECYNALIYGNPYGYTVSNYEEFTDIKLKSDDWIIKADNDYVWGYMNEEILFSESYDNWKGDKSKLTGVQESYDKPIILRKWYLILFDYFSGKRDDVEEYFDLYTLKKSKEEQQATLLEREKLYDIYSYEFSRGMNFFIDTAPLVEWNKSGYFNLIGGHHRTIFLLSRGVKSFPVKMTKKDFDIWKNSSVIEDIQAAINRNVEFSLSTPLCHPAFTNFWSERENSDRTLLESLWIFLEREKIPKNTSIVDLSGECGYFARNLIRTGMTNVSLSTCEEEQELTVKLMKLLRIEIGEIFTPQNLKNRVFDIVIDLDVHRSIKDRTLDKEELYLSWRKLLIIEISEDEKDKVIQSIKESLELEKIILLHTEKYKGKKYYVYVIKKREID